jgi:hypothetical protein
VASPEALIALAMLALAGQCPPLRRSRSGNVGAAVFAAAQNGFADSTRGVFLGVPGVAAASSSSPFAE